MKLQPLLEQLSSSKEFKDFVQKYKDAFITAGFFVLDMETGNDIHQIDYYVPSQKKVAAFTIGTDKVTLQMLEVVGEKVPMELSCKQAKTDLDAIKGILEDEMKNRGITDEIRKIIAVIQNHDGKRIWNLNCVLTGMGLLNAHVEDESQTVLKMEKISMFDLIKKIPNYDMKMNQGAGQEGAEGGDEEGGGQVIMQKVNDNAKEKIKKLEMLQKAIEKEKEKYEREEKEKKQKKK